MHLNGVEGGEDRGVPVEPCSASFEFLAFLSCSEGRDQDGKVANTKRNTVLDGTWVTTIRNGSREVGGKRTKARIWRQTCRREQREGRPRCQTGRNCSPSIASKAPGIFRTRIAWASPANVVINEHEKIAIRRIRSPEETRTSLRIQSGATTRMASDIVSATRWVNDRRKAVGRNKTYSPLA